MPLSLRTERAFRNAIALTYLLFGLSLLAFSMGALLQIGLEFGTAPFDAENSLIFAGAIGLIVALIYLGLGSVLLRNRPRYAAQLATEAPPMFAASRALFRCLLGLSIIVAFLGVLFAYGGALERDSTRAALLILAGAFGALCTILYNRRDVNVRAAAAIVGFLAGVLLLFAQLRFLAPGTDTGTYSAWEITSLVLPRVFGPVAIMVAALSGLVLAYSRSPRPEFGSYFILSLAALIYGLGVSLSGLAFFFDTPWSSFVQVGVASLLQLAVLTAGGVLLTAAGVCILVASVIGLIRNGQGIGQPPPPSPAAPSATTHGVPPRTTTTAMTSTTENPHTGASTTTTRVQRTERTPPTT